MPYSEQSNLFNTMNFALWKEDPTEHDRDRPEREFLALPERRSIRRFRRTITACPA